MHHGGHLGEQGKHHFFFLFSEEHTNHHSIPEPDGPGGLCGPLRITLDFLEFIYRAVPLSSLKE